MKLEVIINNYTIICSRLFGYVGKNNVGLVEGKFISITYEKVINDSIYMDSDIAFILGTNSDIDTRHNIVEILSCLSEEGHRGSSLSKVISIGKFLLGKKFNKPRLKVMKQFRGKTVSTYEWDVSGQSLIIEQTNEPDSLLSSFKLI